MAAYNLKKYSLLLNPKQKFDINEFEQMLKTNDNSICKELLFPGRFDKVTDQELIKSLPKIILHSAQDDYLKIDAENLNENLEPFKKIFEHHKY